MWANDYITHAHGVFSLISLLISNTMTVTLQSDFRLHCQKWIRKYTLTNEIYFFPPSDYTKWIKDAYTHLIQTYFEGYDVDNIRNTAQLEHRLVSEKFILINCLVIDFFETHPQHGRVWYPSIIQNYKTILEDLERINNRYEVPEDVTMFYTDSIEQFDKFGIILDIMRQYDPSIGINFRLFD